MTDLPNDPIIPVGTITNFAKTKPGSMTAEVGMQIKNPNGEWQEVHSHAEALGLLQLWGLARPATVVPEFYQKLADKDAEVGRRVREYGEKHGYRPANGPSLFDWFILRIYENGKKAANVEDATASALRDYIDRNEQE